VRDSLTQLSDCIEIFNSKTFFVVTGVPKSGTTWVQLLCDVHPEAQCHGEDDFNRLLMNYANAFNDYNQHSSARNVRLPSGRYAEFLEGDMERMIAISITMMLSAGGIPDGVKAFGTKFNDLITNNSEFYAALFRDIPVIHVLRDPRDTLVSIFYNNHRVGSEVAGQNWPTLAALILDQGPAVVDAVNHACRVRDSNPATYHEISYEELSHDGTSAVKRLYEFIGIDSSSAVVENCLSQSSFEKLSGGRKSGTENVSSFMRKGSTGDWRQKMDDECLEALDISGISDLVSRLGYDV